MDETTITAYTELNMHAFATNGDSSSSSIANVNMKLTKDSAAVLAKLSQQIHKRMSRFADSRFMMRSSRSRRIPQEVEGHICTALHRDVSIR